MKSQLTPVHYAEIQTPKKVLLNGLWYGPKKADRVVIVIHGLTGSMFSLLPRMLPTLVGDDRTAVLAFNNRGHGIVNRIHKGKAYLTAGSAHEIFTDCVDDLDGAVRFARKQGAKKIYLAGHSTGCQKAVYYAFKRAKKPLVKGLMLFGPVSDHGVAKRDDRNGRLARATRIARTLVRQGKQHELLSSSPLTKWSVDDAQRFLSLYTPDSVETIFPYEQSGKIPRALRAVKVPVLIFWAAKDEYADRSAQKIQDWFAEHLKIGDKVVIVPNVRHNFKGGEKIVEKEMRRFMKKKRR